MRSGRSERRPTRRAGWRSSACRSHRCASRRRPAPARSGASRSRRVIRRRSETSEWIGRPRGERGEVSRWGHLVFDDVLTPPRRIELLPYALARAERQATCRGHRLRGFGRRRSAPRHRHLGDAFGHGEPRLRPGRAGSRGPEPLDFRNVLPGKAPLLPRGQPHVRPAVRELPALSLAAHRPHARPLRGSCRRDRRLQAGGDDGARRGQADRQGIGLDLRRA